MRKRERARNIHLCFYLFLSFTEPQCSQIWAGDYPLPGQPRFPHLKSHLQDDLVDVHPHNERFFSHKKE